MSSGDYIRTHFRKLFEPAGSDVIYRSVPGAAGIRVSAGEHREMETDLDRRIRRLGLLANGWVLAGAALAPLVLLQVYGAHDLVKLAALFCVLMLAVVPQYRLERNVMKRVADRAPVDCGQSWTETTLGAAAKQSWYLTVIFFLAPLTSLHRLLATSGGLDASTRVVFICMAFLAAFAGFVGLSAKAWLALRRHARS